LVSGCILRGEAKTGFTLKVYVIILIALIVGVTFAYVLFSTPPSQSGSDIYSQHNTIALNAAGASFPYPLINSIINQYTNNLASNILINYQPLGSGAGISALKAKTIDFAASDVPLKDSELTNMPTVLHMPETIGAVVLAYNLPGVPLGLKLTGELIADIFLGKLTKWNDASIQSLNPEIMLPDKEIITVHRSDGSGTTYIFTSYLCQLSFEWSEEVGRGKSVGWVSGIGAPGNTGVASVIQGNKYVMGYVELSYAVENNMSLVAIQNSAGNWIMPSLESIQTAVESGAASGLPGGNESWINVNVLNSPDPQAYPIASFSYLLTYQELNVLSGMTLEKAEALVEFLWYVVHDGQNLASELIYSPLPSNVVQVNEQTIKSITFNGQQVFKG